ncbi:hypothetical protein CMQ_7966 [Grosmannia clavigera kw1407]|uniref:DUF2406 domain containing protein n=1 Tax=Grosmannia clavigera (strain kw1407 / UAMH 11150) TaxID=655863 RepID=F0XRZ5_GROCL|nr:uncharacterized protein CMQ_7966 [Grosmannia clavigera kw1407]EFW99598.1 hypothetical protein CMQ_7966 [Grosmannia clavigera kw1407]
MMATYDSPAPQPGGSQHQLPPHQQYQQAQRVQQQQHPKRDSQVQYAPAPSQPTPQVSAQKPPRKFHASQGSNRPRSRSFSLRSDKSGQSGSQKFEPETHDEKERKRLHSKADPMLAMTEAEPSAVAATAKVSLGSIRGVTPRDRFGNVIVEPDVSNPTRSRWERPLDTIRSFEAAIDGGYNRRSSVYQPSEAAESVSGGNTRRNSYFNNNTSPRYPQDAYYAPNPHSLIPATYSQQELRHQRDAYSEQGSGYNGAGHAHNGGGSRPRYNRTATEPQAQQNGYRNGEQNIYPAVGGHRSYETVASGSGASGGEPAGYLTDPTSSDNSSIDRRQSPLKQQHKPGNDYGIGFSQSSAYQPSSFAVGGPRPGNGMGAPTKLSMSQNSDNLAPAPPPMQQGVNVLRKPTTPAPDKRKSWFSRKLSRKS